MKYDNALDTKLEILHTLLGLPGLKQIQEISDKLETLYSFDNINYQRQFTYNSLRFY